MKKIFLVILLTSLPLFSQTQIGDKIPIDARNIELSADGKTIVISEDSSGFANVKTFKYENPNWINYTESDISGNNEMEISRSSLSISQDGNTLAIGSPNEFQDEKIGLVRVYKYQENKWVQIGNDLKTNNINDGFGGSLRGNGTDLSYDGSIIAIGARRYHHLTQLNNGLVKVFKNNSGEWEQMGNDIIGEYTDYSITTGSGVSLSEDGLTLAVGSAKFDYWRGKVAIYKFINNDWVQVGNDINGDLEDDEVGYSISLSGDGNILVIGGPGQLLSGDKGYMKVFQYTNNAWQQIDKNITIDDPEIERFGYRTTISSDGATIAVSTLNKTYLYHIINNSIYKNDIEFDGYPMSLSSDGSILAVEETTTNNTSIDLKNIAVYNIEKFTLSDKKFDISSFKLFPNPVEGNINISLADYNTLEKATIYTINGLEVVSSTNSNIDTSSLPSGIYTIVIETEERNKIIKKIILN